MDRMLTSGISKPRKRFVTVLQDGENMGFEKVHCYSLISLPKTRSSTGDSVVGPLRRQTPVGGICSWGRCPVDPGSALRPPSPGPVSVDSLLRDRTGGIAQVVATRFRSPSYGGKPSPIPGRAWPRHRRRPGSATGGSAGLVGSVVVGRIGLVRTGRTIGSWFKPRRVAGAIELGAMNVDFDLGAVAGLFEASETVTAEEFATMVERIQAAAGLAGIAYAPLVRADDLSEFIAQTRSLEPSYSVFELDAAGEPIPVTARSIVLSGSLLPPLRHWGSHGIGRRVRPRPAALCQGGGQLEKGRGHSNDNQLTRMSSTGKGMWSTSPSWTQTGRWRVWSSARSSSSR